MSVEQVRMILVDAIRVVNPRSREQKKYQKIVESIRLLGLKKPITVAKAESDAEGRERFDLVCGQGRLEAFKMLGEKEIPALVRGLSRTGVLLSSLVENIARRRVRALDQVQMIHWMKQQGQAPGEIAAKTGLVEDYVKDILHLMEVGEERLLEAVLSGRFPLTVAMRIADRSNEESQRILMEAYEKKEMNQRTISSFKRIIDQRKYFGRKYGPKKSGGGSLTTAESLIRAYRLESQRQKLMVRKAKLCEVKLLAVTAAFKALMVDEDYVNLLRAEHLTTMPKFLTERMKELS